jgi:ligand-binding SRPBCC domain-containing protein
MARGALIDYRLRINGIPVRWRTEISAWDPPVRFVDRQLRGPYRWWIHEHEFIEIDGGTLMRDRVEYGVLGGAIVNRLLVQRQVERIFGYRRRILEKHFAAPA